MVEVLKNNLLGMDRAGLEAYFQRIGEKPFRARQIMKWVYQQGETDFSRMTDLSVKLREHLMETAEVRAPEVVSDHLSQDGTRKWLMRVDSGNAVETVFIPEEGRGTLCISSQVGCALDCQFCATAEQGFNRNLTTAEILGQVWHVNRLLGRDEHNAKRLTNVVLMGMGEPLANFRNVMPAINVMLDDLALGLSKRRVTLSTSGVVSNLYRFAEQSEAALAVSLHAPFDELRNEIVPINQKWPLKDLMAACRYYIEQHPGRHITWEYVMLDGVNDGEEHARGVAKLLAGIPSKINLIPFNPYPGARYSRSSDARIQRFRKILLDKGFNVITRKTRGDDIDAACGQLAGEVKDRSRRQERRAAASEGVAS
ncbi:23S rRNA (adenine2503-C2)-methyltransferase [Natronospira proteinivora]|uniref:Dual-specificity RNA methyltransferase RlmN n=1 Tax=Natronospira proteinivora TaxID=1807133 RepID=A0ABT1G8U8_9GAMM|nr:23S rRNA (adenine2503-C2)-methyltransferase [Natronospira proteinivora]